jgi:hypothetical protein
MLAFTTQTGPVTIQPHVIPTLAYRLDSFVPLCQIFAVQYVLAVKPDSPFHTLAELMAAAKARPGQVKYGYGRHRHQPAPRDEPAGARRERRPARCAVPRRSAGDPRAQGPATIDAATMNVGGAKAQGLRILATFAEVRQARSPTSRR